MRIRNFFIATVLILAWVFLAFLGNDIIDSFLISDPCDYHNKEIKTGMVFNLFYEINSSAGNHPEPTAFNFIFTLITGIIIGLVLYKVLLIKREKKL